MKQVFLDTNILVDYAVGREHCDDAAQLLQRGRNGEFCLQASYLTFANIGVYLEDQSRCLYAVQQSMQLYYCTTH